MKTKLFTLHCDDGNDDIKTLLFTTREALEAKQREIITQTIPDEDFATYADSCAAKAISNLLDAGKVEEAWDTWITSSLRDESMNYCVTEHDIELPTPALSAYHKLYDVISDCIEGGRLKETDLPDDYQAILHHMEECQNQDAGATPKQNRAFVFIGGGCLRAVHADDSTLKVQLIDHDNEKTDEVTKLDNADMVKVAETLPQVF